MIEIFYETVDHINGEKPPVIFLRASQKDYSELYNKIIEFENNNLEIVKIDLSNLFQINIIGITTIYLYLSSSLEAIKNEGSIILSLNKTQLRDIKIQLENLIKKKCTVFFEYDWISLIFTSGTIIVESK
ncbi:MAG: hypothetical protein II558_01535 [Treponema sp.]|nr:hypothetical protein [Treponema sp.]MBQ2547562.1 hypothetical protein [Treponema sp.]